MPSRPRPPVLRRLPPRIPADSCAPLHYTHETTYPVSQIWQITNSVDHMDTTAHTAHFYKPHMNSIDNVLHWTCDQACLTTATYVVCDCACCHLTQKYSYIFLEQGYFCRVMQQRFFPLRCQHLPCAHTGLYSYFTSHINWSYSTTGQVQLGLKNIARIANAVQVTLWLSVNYLDHCLCSHCSQCLLVSTSVF